ncbi:MAG TPA: 3-oxoacyl-ACP synthase, partial [Chryseolinea sp.]|nr:3-oxoacyl-ACP synthase [Chryseolinea sp.]
MRHSKIVGLGHHVPETVITNQYLSQLMETNNEWIVERTGIHERRWMNPAIDTVANMAAKATRMALERAKLTEKDIDFIVFATITPDYFFPGSGVLLQRELGLDGKIAALDIRNACSGFIYALSVAAQFIKTGMYKTVLVV